MLHKHLTTISTLLTTLTLAVAQTTPPGPTYDCSKDVVYLGATACNNVVTSCCGPTDNCCGGGCCTYNQVCVFPGTAQAACCPIATQGNCGYNPFPSSGTGSCPASTAQIPCSGVDDSWHCPASCTCDVSRSGGCNCFSHCGGSSASSSVSIAPVQSSSESPAAASSTPAAAATTSSEDLASETASADSSVSSIEESSTSVVVATSTGSGGGGGGGSSTTTGAAGAARSSSPANAAESLNFDGFGAAVFGVAAWMMPLVM